MGEKDVPVDDNLEEARVSRRTVLKGLGAAGLAVGVSGWSTAAARSGGTPGGEWEAFDAAVEREFERMGLVGAAIAVVSSDRGADQDASGS